MAQSARVPARVLHGMRAVERAAYAVGALLILTVLPPWRPADRRWLLGRPPVAAQAHDVRAVVRHDADYVTLIASFLSLTDRARALLLGILAAACVLETFLVSMQAWRGVPSHFNVETPFDAVVAQTLAIGGFALVVVIVALTVLAFRDRRSCHRAFAPRFELDSSRSSPPRSPAA